MSTRVPGSNLTLPCSSPEILNKGIHLPGLNFPVCRMGVTIQTRGLAGGNERSTIGQRSERRMPLVRNLRRGISHTLGSDPPPPGWRFVQGGGQAGGGCRGRCEGRSQPSGPRGSGDAPSFRRRAAATGAPEGIPGMRRRGSGWGMANRTPPHADSPHSSCLTRLPAGGHCDREAPPPPRGSAPP